MNSVPTHANQNQLAKVTANPVHQKLGEMFTEIAGKGALTPELALIYVEQLVTISDEHSDRDEAVLRIHDMFADDPKTQSHIFGIAIHHTSGDQKNLMGEMFARAKLRIATKEKPEQRIAALIRMADIYQMPHADRITAYEMAIDELNNFEDTPEKLSTAISLLNKLLHDGRTMDADVKATLTQRVKEKVFETAKREEDPATSLAMYKEIYDMSRVSHDIKSRALADTVDFVIDRLETPQEAYEAANWVKSNAQAGSELRNRMIDVMPSYVKALPTHKERFQAAHSQYCGSASSYWDRHNWDNPDRNNSHLRALMETSLDIMAYNASRMETLAERIQSMDTLYDTVQYSHRDRKTKVIRNIMALIDRQPTLSEQKAALDYLLDECSPDHGKSYSYELQDTLKGVALQKRVKIGEEISARAEKTPKISPEQFEQLAAGFIPNAPE